MKTRRLREFLWERYGDFAGSSNNDMLVADYEREFEEAADEIVKIVLDENGFVVRTIEIIMLLKGGKSVKVTDEPIQITDEMVESALLTHFNETRKVYGLSFLTKISEGDLGGVEGDKMRKTLEAALRPAAEGNDV